MESFISLALHIRCAKGDTVPAITLANTLTNNEPNGTTNRTTNEHPPISHAPGVPCCSSKGGYNTQQPKLCHERRELAKICTLPARFRRQVLLAGIVFLLSGALIAAGCTGESDESGGGKAFVPVFHDAFFDAPAALTDGVYSIDISHANEGYFAACTTDTIPCKLQVSMGELSYNYDLPADGSPIVVPANMGNGHYTLRVMQNTDANRYIEMFLAEVDVALESETAPFVRPNVFCNYEQDSACVKKASELCANASTESEAFDAVFDFVKNSISYDKDKAASLEQATGYVPNPDETLLSGKGICFDYASLTAAMLRSQGIPTKVLTGYVSPDNIYHAWDMIYIDGHWRTLHISAQAGNWARADMTFAAAGAEDTIGDGSEYSDRYTY